MAQHKFTPLDRSKFEYWVGVDPGTVTGMAQWHRPSGKLIHVFSISIHKAIKWIDLCCDWRGGCFIRIEDARLRTWFDKTGPEVWKGAGSIMRDCAIWQEVLEDFGFDYELVAPKRNKTKMKSEYFRSLTGWEEKTNEHGRDAAMLVYGY